MNLPDYNFFSAPLFVITILHIVTLGLHFIAMNFMLGGVMIISWAKFNNRFGDKTVQKFIKLFPSVMAATITFGVAPLLFLQLVYPRQMYSAAIVSGWFWMLIVVAVIVAYYCFYGVSFSKNNGATRKQLLLSIALLGLLYVSFIYSSIFSMAERPDLVKSLYASHQSGFLINTELSDYIFRWLHMIFGALTVGGFFVGLIGRDNEKAFSIGKSFFMWGMAVAALFGLTYLITLGDSLQPFVKTPGIYSLLVGVVLAALALHFFFKQKFFISSLSVFVSLFSMVTTRHFLRLLRLEGFYDPATIKIIPQWSVFIIFLIFFVLAIALIGYMLRLYFAEEA